MNERVSFVCKRAAQIRKGVKYMTQSDAMKQANQEWKEMVEE